VNGSLLEVLDRLDQVEDSDRYAPLCIFAEGGADGTPQSHALVCPGDEEGSFVCPSDPSLSYVLEVQQAREAIDVWSHWRGGHKPSAADKFAAVMYYSRRDAFLPVEATEV
jgi:hypothetical protein